MTLSILDMLMLAAAGLIGGIISAMIGGAALITFPALLAVGLPPVTAIAVNMVALTPGNFAAAYYDRTQLPPLDRPFLTLIAVSLAGAVVGALLLLVTPRRVFEVLVPLLLGFATVLFANAGGVASWIERHAGGVATSEAGRWRASTAAMLPIAVYAGYFGAGVGVLYLAVLSIGTRGDYRAANVTKNLFTSTNNVVSCAIFIGYGLVVWPPVLAMMAGSIVGSLIGARIAKTAPRDVMRRAVVVVGRAADRRVRLALLAVTAPRRVAARLIPDPIRRR